MGINSVWMGLACLGLVMACAADPDPTRMTSVIERRASSPDAKREAILVHRSYRAALLSDQYFVMVGEAGTLDSAAVWSKHLRERSVFRATWAANVALAWTADDTLEVSCRERDKCTLTRIDIMARDEHAGSTTILYRGIPPLAEGL